MINFTFDLQRFDSAFSGGDGSENNPYQISSQADLEQLARDVNGGNTYAGKHFKVIRDIEMSGVWKSPIGERRVTDKNFSGTFDGDGHVIKNMTINYPDGYNPNENDGLFGRAVNATIKNVNLTNVSIRTNSYDVGGLISVSVNTHVIHCSVQGIMEVNGDGVNVGGIVGFSSASNIRNCAYFGTFKTGNGISSRYGIIAAYSYDGLGGNYYYGAHNNINPKGATQIYDCSLPQGVTSDESVTFVGKSYIRSGDVNFKYVGNTYKYNVTGEVTVKIKDNKFFANDTELGSAIPAFEGDGSENNPFLIKSEADLRRLAEYVNYVNTCAGLNFKLTNDIALTGEFTPIGDDTKPFKGTFDGNGKTISNLTINGSRKDYCKGLFGAVESATIKNVNLKNVNVTGGNYVGALVGEAIFGKIQIINCSAQGYVKAAERRTRNLYVGGLVGQTGGGVTIDGCSFGGSVEGLRDSFYFFHRFSDVYTGGLVGYNNGTVKNSVFVGGTITGGNKGAIVSDNGGTLTDNYYCGTLAEGVKDNGATQIFKIVLPEGVTSSAILTVNGKKYVKAGDATFTYNGKTYNCTVTEDIIVSVEGDNLSFGKLDTAEDFLSTLEGKGSANNPYLIKTEEHLRRLANYVRYVDNCAGKNFKLADDIALTNNFVPVGTEKNPFAGTFDGNNKTVSNLTIDGDANQGLFGAVEGATIQNVKLTNVDVTGKDNVGAVVGSADNKTQVINCSAQGNVKGSANVGGLVGVNNGTVKDGAYLGGTITGTGATKGAIVGKNDGTLTNNHYYGTLLDGVSNNDAAQVFKADLPEGVTSTALVEINGTTYIKAGNVTLNCNNKNYPCNVTGDITVTLDGNKLFVNDTEYTANFPGNLDGEGTENNPFILTSEKELRQFAAYVKDGNDCAGKNFKLANDIKLTENFTPIGTSSKPFNGNFDGDGKTISNLTINGEYNLGLFGFVDNATIKNVKLTNVNIEGNYRLGTLVADANGNSQILNCSASGNIKSNSTISFIGGIVGFAHNSGTVDGCTFSGNLEGLVVPPEFTFFGSHVGGIIGISNGDTVKNCAYLGGTIKSSDGGATVARTMKREKFSNNYYYGKLGEGIADSGATQIFKADLPEGVTSSSIVTLNGTTYIKAGNATLTYGGQNYSHNVSADLTVTLQDDKLSFGDEQSNAAQGLKLHASDNGQTLTGGAGNDSLWGGLGKDTFIHNGGHDIIYGFGKGDTLKTNGFDDITATYDTADNDIKIPCGAGSVTLKDFTTNEFPINNDTWTLSGNTLTKK